MTDKQIHVGWQDVAERYGRWVDELVAEVAAKDTEIVALRKQIDRMERADDLSNCND